MLARDQVFTTSPHVVGIAELPGASVTYTAAGRTQTAAVEMAFFFPDGVCERTR